MNLKELKEHWKKGNRDLETARKIAKFFNTRTEWNKNHRMSYTKAMSLNSIKDFLASPLGG